MRQPAAWRRRCRVGFLCVATLAPVPATAAAASATFNVTATVQATCLVSVGTLAFGTYSGAQIDSTATITVTCTDLTNYYVNIQTTGGFVGPCWSGGMTGPGAAKLTYYIYREPARTSCWGNTNGYDGVAGTGNGSPQPVTAYGRLPAGQYGTPGAYSDTAIVTVAY